MTDIGLIILLESLALIFIVSIIVIAFKVDKFWKFPVCFVLACLACFCLFFPLNIAEKMYYEKHPIEKTPIDTIKLINDLRRRAGYEVID